MAKKRSKILVQALPLKTMQSKNFRNAARQVCIILAVHTAH